VCGSVGHVSALSDDRIGPGEPAGALARQFSFDIYTWGSHSYKPKDQPPATLKPVSERACVRARARAGGRLLCVRVRVEIMGSIITRTD
jgi:hypothetical protein